MKSGWQTLPLGQACEVIAGQSPSGSAYNSAAKGLPFYQGKKGFGDRYIGPPSVWTTEITKRANAGDILMSVRAPVGPVNFATQEICIGRGLAAIRTKPGLDKDFLYYFLLSIRSQISGRDGAVFPSISRSEICAITLSFPSLPEQRRIVGVFDDAFAGLATTTANAEQNLKNARELFDSYLTSVFTQKGKGWKEVSLGEVCAISSKLIDPRKAKFIDLPHLGAGNMASKTGEVSDIKTAREEALKSGKFLFDKTMVLYSKIRPYLMKACRPDFEGLCSADVYPLTPDPAQLDRNFLFHLLMNQDFTDFAVAGSDRAGMPKVNRDHLFKYRVRLPCVEEQERLAAKLDVISAETIRLEAFYERRLADIADLKQSILHKAFSGGLTSPPPQAIKEAAE